MLDKIKISLVSVLLLSSVSNASGFKSNSMGGITTTIKDTNAIFNNPSNISKKHDGMETYIKGEVKDNDLINNLDNLVDLKIQDNVDKIIQNIEDEVNANPALLTQDDIQGSNTYDTRNNISEVQKILRQLNENSFILDTDSGVSFSLNSFSFGVKNTTTFISTVELNPNRTDLSVTFNVDGEDYYYIYNPETDVYSKITESEYNEGSLAKALDDNDIYSKNYIESLTEIPIGYVYTKPLNFKYDNFNGDLNIGGAVKFMYMNLEKVNLLLDEEITSDSFTSGFDNDYNFGIDMGVSYDFSNFPLYITLTGKNLNSPKFVFNKYNETIKRDLELKYGMSYSFFNKLITLHNEIDLTENYTNYSYDKKLRNLKFGLEIEPTNWVSLNTGFRTDLNNNVNNTYSAGISFGFKWFQFGISAETTSETYDYSGTTIPRQFSVGLNLISKW